MSFRNSCSESVETSRVSSSRRGSSFSTGAPTTTTSTLSSSSARWNSSIWGGSNSSSSSARASSSAPTVPATCRVSRRTRASSFSRTSPVVASSWTADAMSPPLAMPQCATRSGQAPWAVRLIFSLLRPSPSHTRKQGSRRAGERRVPPVGHRGAQLGRRLPVLADVEEQHAEVELDHRRVREDGGERAERPEGGDRLRLREQGDGRERARDRIVRRERRGGSELPLRRERLLERGPELEAVEELRALVRLRRRAADRRELGRGRRALRRARQEDHRQAGDRILRVEQILRRDAVRRVGAEPRGLLPRPDGGDVLSRPKVGETEMEQDERARRMRRGEPLHRREAAAPPRGEGRADLRLERVVAREDGCRGGDVPEVVEPLRPRERPRLRVAAQAERQLELRVARLRRQGRPLVPRHEGGAADDRGDRDDGAQGNDHEDTPTRHAASVARNPVTTIPKAMPSYRELLAQLRSEIEEVDVVRAH